MTYEYLKKIKTGKTVCDIENISQKQKGKTEKADEKISTLNISSSEDEYQETDFINDETDVTDEINETDENTDIKENEEKSSSDIEEQTNIEKETNIKEEEETDIKENTDITLKEFKEIIRENKKLDKIISEFGYNKIFDEIDENNDGKITDLEVERLGLSSNTIKDLTVKDIEKLAKEAGLKQISEEKKDDGLPPEILEKLIKRFLETENTDQQSDIQDYENTMPATSSGYAPQISSGYNTAPVYSSRTPAVSSNSNSAQSASSAAADELSISELKNRQQDEQKTVNKKSENLSSITDGTHADIVAAKKDADAKQEKYEELLKNDEKVSEELKKEQEENSKNIKENEEKISEKEKSIADAENKIYNLDNQIESLTSEINSLNTSLSNLPKKTNENKERHAEIDSMKSSIEAKITDTENKRSEAKEEKSQTEETKKADENELKELKETKETLENKRKEIEEKIENSCSNETKQALKDYKEARENIGKVQEKLLPDAQKELNMAQNALEETNKAIAELEDMQIQLENRVGSEGEDVVAFAQKLDGLSASDMKKIMQQAGCRFDDGAWCADFATYVTKQVYGNDGTPGNFAQSCSNTAYCPTIESWAKQNGSWTTNSSEVQPGDYILYTRNGRAGHIGVVTSVNADGSVNTIEGNTSDDNGNYTNGVVNQHYNVRSARGFVKMHALS